MSRQGKTREAEREKESEVAWVRKAAPPSGTHGKRDRSFVEILCEHGWRCLGALASAVDTKLKRGKLS